MQFFSGPVLGMLSDRFGRRPVMLISILGLSLDFLVMAFAPTLAWLLLGRVLNGATAASFSTANAYVADISTPENRARNFGWMSSAFSVGFLLGPAAGGILATHALHIGGFTWTASACRSWSAAGLCAINWIYGLLVLPESLPPERRIAAFDWRRANPVASLALLRSHQRPAAAGGDQLPLPALPAGAAEHLRALHPAALPLVARASWASPSSSPARSASWCSRSWSGRWCAASASAAR